MELNSQNYYEDINVGQTIGPFVKNIDRKQLVMYAGASLDFNEFHYDDDVAKKAGHKGIIIHGALKSAWLAKLLVDFAGNEGNLKKFNVSYRGVDFPYEDLKLSGKVIKKQTPTFKSWFYQGPARKETMPEIPTIQGEQMQP